MTKDKIPPQAQEIEEAVLGAIMLERDAFDLASEILKPECFYSEKHKNIFTSMKRLSLKNQTIDLFTLAQDLSKYNTGIQPHELTRITMNVVSTANLENHCRLVLEKYILRELIIMGSDLITVGFQESTDVFDLLGDHEKKFTDLTSNNLRSGFTYFSDDIVKNLIRISELRKAESHITGVASGFDDLDKITHGWQPTDLIILAARPSVGKTALALNLARNAARQGVAVGRFSLEMSTGQITQRDLSAESGVWLDNISTGRIDNEQMETINKAAAKISEWKIYTDDTGALNIFELRAKARRMKRKHNIGLIIIDYLQLMSGTNGNGNREQEISMISRSLKALAKEMNIPIIALSQLSRKTEDRKGEAKIPQLADLRESGAIEQDADMVLFMYRPEYYDANAATMGDSQKGETHIKIAKHRNGVLDTVKLNAQLYIQKFSAFHSDPLLPQGSNWIPITNEPNKKELPF